MKMLKMTMNCKIVLEVPVERISNEDLVAELTPEKKAEAIAEMKKDLEEQFREAEMTLEGFSAEVDLVTR